MFTAGRASFFSNVDIAVTKTVNNDHPDHNDPVVFTVTAKNLGTANAQDVKLTDAAYACPEPEHLSPDLTTDGFYSDRKSSVIDPTRLKAYKETSGPYRNFGNSVVDAADAYRTTGSRAAARCVARLRWRMG